MGVGGSHSQRPLERILSQTNMIACPSCDHPAWPEKTRGLRVCAQCHATIRLSKHGATVKTRHRFATAGNATRGRKTDRFFRVVGADGIILCACCGSNVDTFSRVGAPWIDGKIDTQENTQIRVIVGHTTINGVSIPEYETRTVPRHIRGIICPACVVRFNAQPMADRTRDPRDARGIKIRPALWNTPDQRESAEHGIMAIVRDFAKHGRITPDTFLEGANWSGMGVREVSRAINGAFELNGQYFAVNAPSDWLTGRLLYSVKITEQGDTKIRKTRSAHPILCGCSACLHVERTETPRHTAGVSRWYLHPIRFRVIRRAPRWEHEKHAQMAARTDGIGRQAVSVADGINAPRERQAIPHTRVAWLERTLPKPNPPKPDPPMHFRDTAPAIAFRRAFARITFA